MSGRELDQHTLATGQADALMLRRAAVHVADRIAAEHPHPLDDLMPRLAGRQLGADRVAAADVLNLLAVLGLPGRAS